MRENRPANREKDLGIWLTWSWEQVAEEVRSLACGLKKLGVELPDSFLPSLWNRKTLEIKLIIVREWLP